jgi:hypothetical protein
MGERCHLLSDVFIHISGKVAELMHQAIEFLTCLIGVGYSNLVHDLEEKAYPSASFGSVDDFCVGSHSRSLLFLRRGR